MISIYIHVPFCVAKCGYCDFFSIPSTKNAVPYREYLDAVVKQLSREVESLHLEGRSVGTIYFGGGTPSIMPPEFFEGVIAGLKKHFQFSPDIEISSEVNPATCDKDWFGSVLDIGVNRISIGVQSFTPRLLKLLGRIHSAEEAMKAIAEAQDVGFKSVSVDLMYAILDESMSELENDLRTAMTFQTEHISAYQLTIEEGTPLCATIPSPLVGEGQGEGDNSLKQMRTVARMLSRGGWQRYEISNFAKKGFECRHNLNYWNYGEYLGLGAGAVSFIYHPSEGGCFRSCQTPLPLWERDGERGLKEFSPPSNSLPQGEGGFRKQSRKRESFAHRISQIKNVDAFLKGVPPDIEDIDTKTAMGEFCFMGFRTMHGVNTEKFKNLFRVSFDEMFGDICVQLKHEGFVEEKAGNLFLTQKGVELSNQIFAQFV